MKKHRVRGQCITIIILQHYKSIDIKVIGSKTNELFLDFENKRLLSIYSKTLIQVSSQFCCVSLI